MIRGRSWPIWRSRSRSAGSDAACDIAVLRAQPGVFGPVASDPTVSRLIGRLAADADDALAAISAARAGARERVWHHAGAPVQNGQVVIDLDATLITAHSEKQDATRTWKKGFGFHPLLGFVDHGDCSGGEPVCELLRPGKAGSNTAADHVVVLDAALAQLPAAQRARDETGQVAVLVRTDAAGATKEFAAHLAEQGVEFSVGASFAHLDVATALAHLPEQAWTPAYQARKPRAAEHGMQIEPRDGAWVAEATGLIELRGWHGAATRMILQRPHPGGQGLPATAPAPGSPTSTTPPRNTPPSRRPVRNPRLRNLPFHTPTSASWLRSPLAQDSAGWCTRLALPPRRRLQQRQTSCRRAFLPPSTARAHRSRHVSTRPGPPTSYTPDSAAPVQEHRLRETRCCCSRTAPSRLPARQLS